MDEVEEWILIMDHYSLTIASTSNDQNDQTDIGKRLAINLRSMDSWATVKHEIDLEEEEEEGKLGGEEENVVSEIVEEEEDGSLMNEES